MASLTHPGTETSSATQLATLLRGTGISPLDNTGWLRITGSDRVRWLNGMATNSIQQLKPGEGNYNFFLNAQGRIQGDATIFAEPDALLLETSQTQLPTLTPLLDRFIIMDDVELADVTSSRAGIAVTGPEASATLEKVGLLVARLQELEMQATTWNSAEVSVMHAYSPLVPHFEIWASAETIENLTQALLAAGAVPCDAQSREWLRILEGTPLYGTDIRDRDLPQETAQARALHFNKGCYLGQEIVERIRSRGNVHRTFTAFQLEGELPAAGAALEAEGKPVGELTSVAAIPLPEGSVQLGLGYIRREALERGIGISYPGGIASPIATPYRASGLSAPNTPQAAS
ncbi:glycine cleavage system protein T [Edaphobacter acidisoli]|uniref:Glycine cleavage system protein T n=1 Tax=Edaphobacter acidisoli TaxID=2040573 RepID=A0A916S1S7_9BACT|nr:folate-binding protein [Edaphobacter acidisoli]GGA79396.1 glycine cleavage system protein T [Edaphobacter acidisoli]